MMTGLLLTVSSREGMSLIMMGCWGNCRNIDCMTMTWDPMVSNMRHVDVRPAERHVTQLYTNAFC